MTIQDGQDPPTIPSSDLNDRQIFNMQFVESDKKLNFFRAGHPVHNLWTHTGDPIESGFRPPIVINRCWLQVNRLHDAFIPSAVGMPFYGSHVTSIRRVRPTCATSYLALSIVSETDQPPHAYIVKGSDTRPGITCDHEVHLDNGRKLIHWDVAAYLVGWRQGTSSLGTVMAMSPKGTRLAAAMWSRVLIWSFDPKLLLQGDLQHYFPPHDFNVQIDLGRLRPTILSSEGVVHKMQFTDETNLYAITDQGLVTWDIGHLSKGKKKQLSLRYDAWPKAAATVPTLGARKRQKLESSSRQA